MSASLALPALLIAGAGLLELLWLRQPVDLARDVPLDAAIVVGADGGIDVPEEASLLVRCPGIGDDGPATWRSPRTGDQVFWDVTSPAVPAESYCGDADVRRWGVGVVIVLLGVGAAVLVVVRGRIGERRRALVAAVDAGERP